ncbi:MAG TPA: zf-HC2 domain-containing protein [Polyangiaceae bacterium]|nr:zf-HC2 domain-containing protein [Polyangiaceae bacterium]
MRAICAQAWQAEAVEDGRLSGAELESFERHAATCADCRRERLVLAELRVRAGRLPPSEPAPLERRRQRQLLLRRASELGQRSGEPLRRWPALALALLAVGVGLFAFSRSEDAPHPPVETVAAQAPTYRLSATPGSRWRILELGAALRLRLDIGDVELQVDKLSAGQRFVLELPDGEVEVVGTRFRAVASALGTEQVRVSEGHVALRLARRAPLSLAAGESWERATEEKEAGLKVTPATPDAGVRAPLPAGAAAARSASDVTRAHGSKHSAGSQQRPSSSAAADGVEAGQRAGAGADFAQAMAAFDAGDYGRAEGAFLGFERRHPGDARCEDATFLRAVARARRGDAAGASMIAREYLERYPSGLRVHEAKQLITPSAKPD